MAYSKTKSSKAKVNLEKTIVISVGGSIIVPDSIDLDWLRKFKISIEKLIKKGYRFIIICGGGKIARNYQSAARNISVLDSEDMDWLGIHCTRLNAHLLRTIFKNHAHHQIIKNPNENIDFKTDILVAAGWKPGFSTDYDAVLIAKNLGIKNIINFTNIDFVYDKDPNKFSDAKKIEQISWTEFRRLIPKEWSPGLNSPFDPVAARESDKLGLKVAILNGSNILNFENYVQSKKFKGTVIENKNKVRK